MRPLCKYNCVQSAVWVKTDCTSLRKRTFLTKMNFTLLQWKKVLHWKFTYHLCLLLRLKCMKKPK